ncbi:MAG: class I SAM-dependent methyltransferase [Bdellovibrionales bacterium]|nr:class I SAM-dependent methyltransferase [Bdellovibrionales bacterium]
MNLKSLNESIRTYYRRSGLLDKILVGIERTGKCLDSLNREDLASIDQFHTRGLDASIELIQLAQVQSSDCVLDVGCGLGGSCRLLASQFGSKVVGVDLTDEFIDVAKKLTEIVGLDSMVSFKRGDALELPFDNASFDLVWTEHTQMNIADKFRFYKEIARVLKPAGRMVFHDVFQSGAGVPKFPVPWAKEAKFSFLVSEDKAKEIMMSSGLLVESWVGKRDVSAQFLNKLVAGFERSAKPPFGANLLMGEDYREKLQNYESNLKQNRVTVAMGRLLKV